MAKPPQKTEIALEESLSDAWSKDPEVIEVPLGSKPMFFVGLIIFSIGALFIGRVFFLGVLASDTYKARAEANLNLVQALPAPRGLIFDRYGKPLVENRAIFRALLNLDKFLGSEDIQTQTLEAVQRILGLTPDELWATIEQNDFENGGGAIVINPDLTQAQIVELKELHLASIAVENSFERRYLNGEIFSSAIGYTGSVTPDDLKNKPNLLRRDVIGKAGVELSYDEELRGQPGTMIQKRNAKGELLGNQEVTNPRIGQQLTLTIDADFQSYFYRRMQQGLDSLGRTKGVGLALDPRNGEILVLIDFPVFNNTVLSSVARSVEQNSGQAGQARSTGSTSSPQANSWQIRNQEKEKILNSQDHPLFNRAIAGFYNPGSTIKPLVGTAALKEGVIDPFRKIFSPGYLDILNPYNPDAPTRYLDWRYQGDVDLAAAIAQSSNVYFYEVGGGSPEIKGLGISRLHEWWQKFNLGNLSGVDLPGEAKGFLPSPEWKQKKTGKPWLLGDTYNVSIGQGDLLLTPIQLLSYIGAIANGGTMYQPLINKNGTHKVSVDLSSLEPQFREVRKGMRQTVTVNLGTAHTLADIGFPVEAKTGSAQINNNAQENAFFVGYLPADPSAKALAPAETKVGSFNQDKNSPLAILILVENSREGSLNAVPIAKDILSWYYEHRVRK